MATQSHIEIREKCNAAIPALSEKFNLGKVNDVQLSGNGVVNPCFFVNDEFIIRFNVRDPNLPKFMREKIVFERLGETSIPVPKVLGIDSSRELINCDVLITTRLPGKNIGEQWKLISKKDRISLARQAGKILREIHNTVFDKFGEISDLGPFPQTNSWYRYLEFKLEYHIEESRKLGIFSDETLNKFKAVLISFSNLLNSVNQASLVHMDYHLENLLFEGQVITGVLDFEWALAGDPIFDFCRWQNIDEVWIDSQIPFFEGYGRKLSLEEKQRLQLYQMIQSIELSVVMKLHRGEEEMKFYQKKSQDLSCVLYK